MLLGVHFKNSNIGLHELTENTILLCDTTVVKDRITNDLVATFVDKTAEHVNLNEGYEWIDNNDVSFKKIMNFLPTSKYQFNARNIHINLTVSIEPAIVCSVKSLYDIWFVRLSSDDKLLFYPLTEFENYEKYNDLDALYKAVMVGRFSIKGDAKAIPSE